MSEVEKGAAAASQQEGVEKNDAAAPATLTSEDIASLAEALKGALDVADAEKKLRVKAEENAENYKKGMLKAKGKLKSDDDAGDENDDDDADEGKDKDGDSPVLAETVKQLLKRNAELVTAVVHKTQVSSAPAGAGSESKVNVSDNLLSADQLANLKARGWNDEKIARFKQNLLSSRS